MIYVESIARFADGFLGIIFFALLLRLALFASRSEWLSLIGFGLWVLSWAASFLIAKRKIRAAWLIRLALASSYFVYLAIIWHDADWESKGWLLVVCLPFAALLLFYLSLFLLWLRSLRAAKAAYL